MNKKSNHILLLFSLIIFSNFSFNPPTLEELSRAVCQKQFDACIKLKEDGFVNIKKSDIKKLKSLTSKLSRDVIEKFDKFYPVFIKKLVKDNEYILAISSDHTSLITKLSNSIHIYNKQTLINTITGIDNVVEGCFFSSGTNYALYALVDSSSEIIIEGIHFSKFSKKVYAGKLDQAPCIFDINESVERLFFLNEKQVVGLYGYTILIIDIEKKTQKNLLQGNDVRDRFYCPDVTKFDDNSLICQRDKKIYALDVDTEEQEHILTFEDEFYVGSNLQYSHNQVAGILKNQQSVGVRNLIHPLMYKKFSGDECIYIFNFSPDGKLLIVGSDNMHVWNISNDQKVALFNCFHIPSFYWKSTSLSFVINNKSKVKLARLKDLIKEKKDKQKK